MQTLQKLEQSLHQYEIRSNAAALDELLHPEFKEIGYSGVLFDRKSIIDDVLTEQKPEYKVWSQDYQFIKLTADTIQLIYKEARIDSSDNLSRHALRTSIWQKNDSKWQIRFHQGTPINAFIKSSA